MPVEETSTEHQKNNNETKRKVSKHRGKSREDKTRHNKLYRTPPTPSAQEQREDEKGFVLDSIAVSSISKDYSRAQPKLGPVIPPYNSQNDAHVSNYFRFIGVASTLKKTDQMNGGTSAEGKVMDKFHNEGHGYKYLKARNKDGAGNSIEQIDGHSQFMQGVKPILGYNGKYGFRRNTPWLRTTPSPFGTGRSPTY